MAAVAGVPGGPRRPPGIADVPTYPAGSLLITDDRNTSFTTALAYGLAENGTVLGSSAMSQCERGDILPNGIVLLGRRTAGFLTHLDFYDTALALTSTLTVVNVFGVGATATAFSPIRGNFSDRFYVAANDEIGVDYPNVRVSYVTAAGAAGGTIWTIPHPLGGAGVNNRIQSMAPNFTNTILYYTWSDPGNAYKSPIFRYDLVNNVALGAWVAADALFTALETYVLSTGDVLQLYGWSAAGDAQTRVKRFNSAGVLQETYVLPDNAQDESPAFIGINWGDQSYFWIRTFEDTTPPLAQDEMSFRKIATVGGAELVYFTEPYPTGSPVTVGVPKSCPLLVIPSDSVCPNRPTISSGAAGAGAFAAPTASTPTACPGTRPHITNYGGTT